MPLGYQHHIPPHLGDQEHEAPPPVPPPEQPALDPQLQNAMTALITTMTCQFHDQALAACTPLPLAIIHNAPHSWVKTHDPDPYDGSDPTKLHAFILQCKLMFRAHPCDFQDDVVKITYAVSWLKGTTLCWYELNLMLNKHQLLQYALDWDTFEETLKTTFREPDPVQTATYKLNSFQMQDYHHITKYNIKFNEYAMITSFCNEYCILPSPTQPLQHILASSDTSDVSAALC
jgi:hypothetical protein